MNVVIHCDTSFNNGISCTGYIININNEIIKGSSSVFNANNNNEAEIMGILISCKIAIKKIKKGTPSKFIIFNDNIVAVTVTDSRYKPSAKAKKKFKAPNLVKEWCELNDIQLTCIRKKRSSPLIKECDKLSKVYRRQRKIYELLRIEQQVQSIAWEKE